jgi:hypothetical protein
MDPGHLNEWYLRCEEAGSAPQDNPEEYQARVCEEWAEELLSMARDALEVACPNCRGLGHRSYPNTATWRRGCVAGQAFTDDVCDECWGTGRTDQKGANLRALDDQISLLKREVSLRYFAEAIGGNLEIMKANLLKVADKLSKARWKDFWEGHAGHCVEEAIRKAVEPKNDK